MNLEEYYRRIDHAHTVTGIPSYWDELQEVISERDRLLEIVKTVAQAVTNEGVNPEYHRKQLEHVRVNWGTLYRAIQLAVEESNNR